MFTAMMRGAGSARTIFHLRPAGNPAPPSPRRPAFSIVAMTSSTVRSPATHAFSNAYPPSRTYASIVVYDGTGAVNAVASIAASTAATVARSIGFWFTTAIGAVSQRPTHGAPMTRTRSP